MLLAWRWARTSCSVEQDMSPICRSEKPKHLAFCRRSASQSHLTRKKKKIKLNSEKTVPRKTENETMKRRDTGFLAFLFVRFLGRWFLKDGIIEAEKKLNSKNFIW